MVGGLISSTILTLVVIPAAYTLVQRRRLRSLLVDDEQGPIATEKARASQFA